MVPFKGASNSRGVARDGSSDSEEDSELEQRRDADDDEELQVSAGFRRCAVPLAQSGEVALSGLPADSHSLQRIAAAQRRPPKPYLQLPTTPPLVRPTAPGPPRQSDCPLSDWLLSL